MDYVEQISIFAKYLGRNNCITVEFHGLPDKTAETTAVVHCHKYFEIRLRITNSELYYIDIFAPDVYHQRLDLQEHEKTLVLELSPQQPHFNLYRLYYGNIDSEYFNILLRYLLEVYQTDKQEFNQNEFLLLLQLFFCRMQVYSARHGQNIRDRVETMLSYLKSYYYRLDLSIGEMAEVFGFSPNYIQTVFKKYCNCTPRNYLSKVRLEMAAELLTTRNYTVKMIAQRCGFSSAQYFNLVFHRHFGCTPANFRLRNSGSYTVAK